MPTAPRRTTESPLRAPSRPGYQIDNWAPAGNSHYFDSGDDMYYGDFAQAGNLTGQAEDDNVSPYALWVDDAVSVSSRPITAPFRKLSNCLQQHRTARTTCKAVATATRTSTWTPTSSRTAAWSLPAGTPRRTARTRGRPATPSCRPPSWACSPRATTAHSWRARGGRERQRAGLRGPHLVPARPPLRAVDHARRGSSQPGIGHNLVHHTGRQEHAADHRRRQRVRHRPGSAGGHRCRDDWGCAKGSPPVVSLAMQHSQGRQNVRHRKGAEPFLRHEQVTVAGLGVGSEHAHERHHARHAHDDDRPHVDPLSHMPALRGW